MKSKDDKQQRTIEFLLRSLLAVELWRGGLSQDEIARRLGISKSDVNAVLKGLSREIVLIGTEEK